MSNSDNTNRLNSLLAPWFADGGLSMVFAAAPLLAIQQGADAMFLGTMGILAQGVRLPLCLIAGKLSERVGRKQVTIPAAILTIVGCFGLAMSHNAWTTCLFFALCVAMMGAFYPPLQAFIGDVSGPGRLAKNLGAFNVGWCVGSAVAAQIAARLLKLGFAQTFIASAVFIVISLLVIALWKKPKAKETSETEKAPPPKVIAGNDIWLLIGRFGHYTGFFGYAAIRMLFPKVGVALGWTNTEIASITGFMLWGLGLGIFITGISPWWRGKIWPQLTAHAGMVVSAVGMGIFQDKVLLAASFLVFGTCLATCYTTAIYHGLAARSKMGRNMGIHEALVAAGQISGSILGGIAAQQISLRAPYFILAGVAACAFMASVYLYRTIDFSEQQVDKSQKEEVYSEEKQEDDRDPDTSHGRKSEEHYRSKEQKQHVATEPQSKEQRHAQVLGLGEEFTEEDVKRAYREQVAKYHPDKVNHLGDEFKSMATVRTREILEAYDYFRVKYDLK